MHESEPRLVAAQLHSAFFLRRPLYVQAGRNFLRLGQREDLEELLTALNEVLATPAAEHGRRVAHFNDRLWFHALTAHWSQLSGELDAAKERIMSSFQLIEDTPERRNPSVMGNLARVRTEFHLLLGHIHRAQGKLEAAEEQEGENLAEGLAAELLALDIKRWRALTLMQQKRHDEASLISKEVLETRKADAEVAQGQYAEVLAGHYDAFGHCVFATDKNYYKALYYFSRVGGGPKRL